MKVSYLITCRNESGTLQRLLEKVTQTIAPSDEVVILQDSTDKIDVESETWKVLLPYIRTQTKTTDSEFSRDTLKYLTNDLDKNFGAHKNFGVEKCSGDFIFQIDGDEMPPDYLLGENLHALLEANPTIEAYAIPRINAWIGLTAEHAKQWGWPLDHSPTYNRVRAAWPDYQWRLFKRDPRIRFKNRLHERIDGFKEYVILPAEEDFALYHDKTIETQIATNERYNRDFTNSENRGVSDKRA